MFGLAKKKDVPSKRDIAVESARATFFAARVLENLPRLARREIESISVPRDMIGVVKEFLSSQDDENFIVSEKDAFSGYGQNAIVYFTQEDSDQISRHIKTVVESHGLGLSNMERP